MNATAAAPALSPAAAPTRHRLGMQAPDLLVVPLILLAGFGVNLLRGSSVILHPELFAEDGPVWFAGAYNDGWFHPLLSPHTGYLQTLPRLTADVGLLVPLRWLPALFVGVAVLVQILPAALLASRRFDRLIPSLWVRLLFAAVYLVLPNASEINANLTDAQWHLGLVALLVVLAAPGGWAWCVFDVIFVVLSGLTGPFTVALLPILVVLYLVRRQRWCAVLLIIAAVTSAIQAVALLTSPRDQLAGLGLSLARLVEIVGGQMIGGTFLGQGPMSTMSKSAHYLRDATAFGVLGLLIMGLAIWRGPLELKLFNAFAVIVSIASLASPVASVTVAQWQVLAHIDGVRYWFFPTLALLADILSLALRIGAWHWTVSIAAALAFASICAWGVRGDFAYDPLMSKPNWAAEVAAFDRAPAQQNFTFVLNPPGWTMVLDKK